MTEQQNIDELADEILAICNGKNSSMCVLAMMAVIEKVALSDLASDDFRDQTYDLVYEQATRIKTSMMDQSEFTH